MRSNTWGYSVSQYICVFIGFSGYSSSGSSADITAIEIKSSLEQAVERFNSVRILVANRGGETLENPQDFAFIRFIEAWVSGADVQFRETLRPGASLENLPDFVPSIVPYKGSSVSGVEGIFGCARDSGDLRWGRLQVLSRPSRELTQLYSFGKSRRPLIPIRAPLVFARRKWSGIDAGWCLADKILRFPVSDWKVKDDVDSDSGSIEVEIAKQAPVREGNLSRSLGIHPIYKAWFVKDPDGGYHVRKIYATVKYEFNGQMYDCKRVGAPSVLYEASDLKEFSKGMWIMSSGKEEAYGPSPDDYEEFSHEEIISAIVSNGIYLDDQPYSLYSKKEWRILEVAQIPLGTDLWIDAPDRVLTHNVDTDQNSVSGVSLDEANQILDSHSKRLPKRW